MYERGALPLLLFLFHSTFLMKKFFISLLILLLIAAGGAFWGYQKLNAFQQEAVNVKPDQLLIVERGTTGQKLAALFEQEKLVDNAQ